jgi:hypothetical protein
MVPAMSTRCLNVKVNRNTGLQEIAESEWKAVDSHFELSVHDKHGWEWRCFLQPRPPYCDRGHMMLFIEGPGIDCADGFPRYFFTMGEADRHVRMFLKWRLWKIRAGPSRKIGDEMLHCYGHYKHQKG